jgi:hypothetical protein
MLVIKEYKSFEISLHKKVVSSKIRFLGEKSGSKVGQKWVKSGSRTGSNLGQKVGQGVKCGQLKIPKLL